MIEIISKNKLLFMGLIIICGFVLAASIRFFDKKPFRFEDFKTADELKRFLETRYPIGSNANIAYKDLELAGARCKGLEKEKNIQNDLNKYEYIDLCKYSTGLFSLPPYEQYQVIILSNKYNKLIKFSVGKYSGLTI